MGRTGQLLCLMIALCGCGDDDGAAALVPDAGGAPPADAGVPPQWAGHCAWEDPPPRVAGAVESGALLAGAAETLLQQPLGTPMGGYMARSTTPFGLARPIDDRDSPFAFNMVPSVGAQTRIPVRAVVLEAGGEVVFLVKSDIPYGFDGTLFALERAIGERTGIDARGRVLWMASHSHAGPGRISGHFLYQQGMDLGMAEAVERLAEAAADVAGRAYEERAAATIGFSFWDGWDPGNQIYGDRRSSNDGLTGGPHKDERLMLVRVDRADGSPLALLHSFGMHGTIGDGKNPYWSVDSTGHVDLALEEEFDQPVVVMHMQGAAGDASPGGVASMDTSCVVDDDCHGVASATRHVGCVNGACTDVVHFEQMESIGVIAAPRIKALYDATSATAQDVELELLTRTIPTGPTITVEREYATLEYLPYQDGRLPDNVIYDQLGRVATPIDEFNVPYGAFECGEGAIALPGWGIQGIDLAGVYGKCLDVRLAPALSVPGVLNVEPPVLPLCETLSTTISLLRVGLIDRTVFDGIAATRDTAELVVAFMPGEPTALYAEAFRERSPAGEGASWLVGYTHDFKGYLLLVEDWLTGGYEPTINVWGPLEGEHFLEEALALADLAVTPEREDSESGFPRPVYPDLPRLEREPDATPSAGTVPDDVPETLLARLRVPPAFAQPDAVVPRVTGRATFVWRGGDPQVDPARVALERLGDGGAFVAITRRSGRPVDDRGKEIFLTYTPDPLEDEGAPRAHLYMAEWQAVAWDGDALLPDLDDFAGVPAGVYRLHAYGRFADDGGDVADYDVASDPFEVAAATLTVSAAREGDTLLVDASYPGGPGFRLLDLAEASNRALPLRGGGATIEAQGEDGAVLATSTQEGEIVGTFTRFTIVDVPAGVATFRVTDRFGNAGTAAAP
ncbi:MAG: hypothetical protein AABZ30_02910, partial [Myxococcota bacterium]